MAKLALKKAATDVTVYLFAQDSSKTTGVGLAGLAYNTASLTAYYVRPLGSATAITLATQTVTGAHSDGGFVEVDATNMPGVYRLDLPDAVCATGVPSAVVMLKGAANLAPVLLEIQLTDFDLNDASPNVTVNDMATDSLTAAALKADALTKIQNGLALEATLTAIKGAGWTTETLVAIDVLIDAIKAKTDQLTFTTANKVDASATVDPTGIATSAALAVVDANVDAIKLKTDALDLSSVSVSSPISGTTITILRGDTLEVSVSDLGSLASYVSLDFTVKADKTQADSDSLIRIRLNATGLADGLLTLNGATASNADDGSIAITDQAAGDITITLAASCTDDLATGTYAYDVQLIEADEVSTLTSGKATVIADVTRAVA